MTAQYIIPYIELHLTNRCNVMPACPWCTYTDVDREAILPMESLAAFLQAVKPSFLLLAGGGEPTVYHYKGKGFGDVVKYIRGAIEGLSIKLVTNGVSMAQLEEISIDEVGVSLDPSYYYGISVGRPKRDKLYWRLLESLRLLLSKSAVPRVMASFVYRKDHLNDLLMVAQDLFACIGKLPSLTAKRFCFLPRACADDTISDVYHGSNLTETESKRYRERMDALIQASNSDLRVFLKSHTRIESPLTRKETTRVAQCGMVANYVLVAADGHLYPCCVAAAKGQASLGPIDTKPDELYARRKSFWDHAPADFCKWCRIKNTLMGSRAWGSWQ